MKAKEWSAEEGDRVLANPGGGLDMWGMVMGVDDELEPPVYTVVFDEMPGRRVAILDRDIARLHRGAGPVAEKGSAT